MKKQNMPDENNKLTRQGLLDKDRERIIGEEIKNSSVDNFIEYSQDLLDKNVKSFYDFRDTNFLAGLVSDNTGTVRLYDLERLLERDKLREKDGFPRKIKLGQLVKPAKEGGGKAIIIPTASEEKLYHNTSSPENAGEKQTGGSGEGEEGEVIGEESLRDEGEGEGSGQGKSGQHGMGAEAYDIGRILTEQFELPNIKDKGKKTSFTKYTYELTDKNRGHGQIIDKKLTLKQIVKSNLALGKITLRDIPDTSKMIISPGDKVYRILSKERDYESQAIVFFLRDYSGSMSGKPTEVVVNQHVYVNSWLVYQYKRQVKSRFVLHDSEAIEVPDFYTYFNKQVAGGTEIASGYKFINEIVEKEDLAKNYNIYIFHGTDGDDWDDKGKKSLPELEKMIKYANRIGITIAVNEYQADHKTVFEQYLQDSNLLTKYPDIVHMQVLNTSSVNEEQIIKSIKELIS